MSTQKPPSRTADQFVVRFPDGMRDRIAAEAKKNNRSMNAEIVSRLHDSLAAGKATAKVVKVDEHALGLFAEKVGQVLDEREKRRKKT